MYCRQRASLTYESPPILILFNKNLFCRCEAAVRVLFSSPPLDTDCVAAKKTGEVGAHKEGTASAKSLTAWCVLIYQKTILQCWGTVFTACTSPRASGSSDVDFLECQRFHWPLLEPQTGWEGGAEENTWGFVLMKKDQLLASWQCSNMCCNPDLYRYYQLLPLFPRSKWT